MNGCMINMDENVRIPIENNFVIWQFWLKKELMQTNYMYIQWTSNPTNLAPTNPFLLPVYIANTCNALNFPSYRVHFWKIMLMFWCYVDLLFKRTLDNCLLITHLCQVTLRRWWVWPIVTNPRNSLRSTWWECHWCRPWPEGCCGGWPKSHREWGSATLCRQWPSLHLLSHFHPQRNL